MYVCDGDGLWGWVFGRGDTIGGDVGGRGPGPYIFIIMHDYLYNYIILYIIIYKY